MSDVSHSFPVKMGNNTFTVTVDLKAFFANHKSKVKIFINENIKLISDLEHKITEIFGIQKYHLMCNDSLLPSCEDIRVLGNGDTICALPNEDAQEVKLLDETYYKEKEKPIVLKEKPIVSKEKPIVLKEKKKRVSDLVGQVEGTPNVEKKLKKKKPEISTPQKEVVSSPIKKQTPKKPEKEIPMVIPSLRRQKVKPIGQTVSWSTNPLPKTINHVKIDKIPVEKPVANNSDFLLAPICSTLESQRAEEYHAFPCMVGRDMNVPGIDRRYPSAEKEHQTASSPFTSLPVQNSTVEPAPVTTKKDTELKNWKQSILEKFTHHLQISEEIFPKVEKDEISSTNKEKDDSGNVSSSNSVVAKVTDMNPESQRIKKINQLRQATGVAYYLKLMDVIGWDSTKSILGINPSNSTEVKAEVEMECKNSNSNGDSMSDGASDSSTKRKRKRRHKKRSRPATPIPRITTPIPMKYFEELSSNGHHSTPTHIRFDEVKEPVSGQGTPVPIRDLDEGKPEENVKILQNLSLNKQSECCPSKAVNVKEEPAIDDYIEIADSPQMIENICKVCDNEKSHI